MTTKTNIEIDCNHRKIYVLSWHRGLKEGPSVSQSVNSCNVFSKRRSSQRLGLILYKKEHLHIGAGESVDQVTMVSKCIFPFPGISLSVPLEPFLSFPLGGFLSSNPLSVLSRILLQYFSEFSSFPWAQIFFLSPLPVQGSRHLVHNPRQLPTVPAQEHILLYSDLRSLYMEPYSSF